MKLFSLLIVCLLASRTCLSQTESFESTDFSFSEFSETSYLSFASETTGGNAPEPCHIPVNFQASFTSLDLSSNCAKAFAAGEVFYDYERQGLRLDLVGSDSTFGSYVATVWQDYNAGSQFVYDRQSGQCSRFSLSGSLDKPKLDSGAFKYGGSAMLGSEEIRGYYASNKTSIAIVTVTTTGCFPFTVQVFSSEGLKSSEKYVSVVPDVPRYIWDLPSQCLHHDLVIQSEDEAPHVPLALKNVLASLE